MSERLAALFARRTLGIRPGVDAVAPAYEALSRPAGAVPAIHIVGTNGKGSTAAMAAALLAAQGHAVGLYTSPHLHRVTERVRVRGTEVATAPLEAAVERVLAVEDRADLARPLSFFEVLTLAALVVFDEAELDVLVVEAGLGGRLDATRLVDARAVAVTPIALDHQQWLGDSLEAIAREKAGVFAPGIPVFSTPQEPAAHAVLQAHAASLGAPFRVCPPLPAAPLPGAFQHVNAAVALAAAHALDPACTADALAALTEVDLDWPARLQAVAQGAGEWVLDVAHNPAAVATLANELERRPARSTVVLFASSPDKDVVAMAGTLRRLGPIWTLTDETHALVPAPGSAREFDGVADPTLQADLDAHLAAGGRVLVCGSHRLVAAVRGGALDPSDPR